MKLRHLLALCLLLCLGVPLVAQAATVRATLDRSTVQLGETVTLNLHVSGGGGFSSLPNLAPLQADFDVLGTSQSSSLSIVNGQRSAELVIGVVLRPRHAGTLVIPALSVAGAQTTPLSLTVQPAAAATAGAQGGPGKSVFMQAEVQPKTAWVGQQLSYVVRLYYSGNLTRGSLDTPQIDGVQLAQVGKDLRYDAVRGGQDYHVIERDYALTPQHAGSLQIPALGFQGESIDPSDPDSFFNFGTRVSASAPPLTVQVQAPPADWGSATWLPARALSLTLDGWPAANATVRVGQPINLSMKLVATGLPAQTLPALSLPAIPGATVYPDQPKSSTGSAGPWLVGSVTRAFAVVPEQAGQLTMPATTLRWFNVATGQIETAEIPAHSLTVLPAAGVAAGTATPMPSPAAAPVAVSQPAAAAPVAPRAVAPWRWIALAAILLWLATVLAWWRSRRQPRVASAVAPPAQRMADTRQLQQAFRAATRGGDAAAQLRCLMDWAQAERPQLRNAGELAGLLVDVAQQRALAALQQRCYGNGNEAPVAGLAEAFARGFAWRSHAPASDDGLPSLYPFDLQARP